MEDASPDRRERKKRKQEPRPPLNGAFGATDRARARGGASRAVPDGARPRPSASRVQGARPRATPAPFREEREGTGRLGRGGAGAWSRGNPATRAADDNARTRRSGTGNQRRRGSLSRRERACAREGARAPQRFRLLGEGAHASAAASFRRPRQVPGVLPAPFPAVPRGSVAAAAGAAPSRAAGRSGTAELLQGAGSHTGAGRPLPPEGRRLRGREWSAVLRAAQSRSPQRGIRAPEPPRPAALDAARRARGRRLLLSVVAAAAAAHSAFTQWRGAAQRI